MTIRFGGAWRCFAIGAAAVTILGCESSTEVNVGDLEGTWSATEARIEDLEAYKLGNVDLIAEGYAVTFSSPGNGDFTLVLDPPEGDPQYVIGTMVIDGTRTTVTTEDNVTEGEVFYQDDQAALSMTAGLTYDFSGNGQEKPAKLLIVMDRVSLEPSSL